MRPGCHRRNGAAHSLPVLNAFHLGSGAARPPAESPPGSSASAESSPAAPFLPALLAVMLLGVTLWVVPAPAQEPAVDERRVEVGTVVYVEGAPQVFRDGEVMSNPADFGFPVESFDLLRTGSDDLLEIETNPDLGTEARIVVQPESVLYLDMSVLRSSSDGGSRSAIELVHGSMTVVVDRLSRDGTFEVAMDSTTLGVRGTTFNVDVAFNGNVLVTAEEGRVEVRDARGRILFADPERAVEWLDPARFRNIGLGTAVPDRDGIRSFRRRWIADRLQELRRNPAALLRVQAQRYLEARQELTRVYRLLMARRDVLDQWIDEERRLLRSSRDARSRQLERVAPHLRSALPILRRYERLHYQLRRTAELYRAEGLDPELPVTDDLTAEELFALVEGDVAVFERRMNVIRYVAKLYVRRNSGVLPQPENAAE